MNKAAAANEHSMKVHKTPLVHFKLPPKDRDASTTFSEGGVLVDLAKADEKTREQHQEKQRKLDNMLYDPLTGYMQSSPAYSNQNVGDRYAISEGTYFWFFDTFLLINRTDEVFWNGWPSHSSFVSFFYFTNID